MRHIVIPVLEEYSGKQAGVDFGVCNNPEFLREGTAVKDFRCPAKTVIGEIDPASGELLASLYAAIDAPLHQDRTWKQRRWSSTSTTSWHALKIGFANEIGNLCKSLRCGWAEGHEDLLHGHQSSIFLLHIFRPALLSAAPAFPRTCGRSSTPPKCSDLELAHHWARSSKQRTTGCTRPAAHHGQRAEAGRHPGLQL